MDQTLVTRIVEAALLAASQPLTVAQLSGLFPLDEPAPDGSVAAALADLQAGCAGRGVELVEVASGWRYQVQADVHPWVARLWTERQTRYTRATLETLALIAYRQPITRGEIEQIRGVAVNSNIIKALEEREWIRVVGHRDVPGKPELLGTTKGFLDYFGLKRLDELPPLSQLRDFAELEPQLALDDVGAPAAGASGAMALGDVALDAAQASEIGVAAGSDPGAGREADRAGDHGIDTGLAAEVRAETDADAEPAHAAEAATSATSPTPDHALESHAHAAASDGAAGDGTEQADE